MLFVAFAWYLSGLCGAYLYILYHGRMNLSKDLNPLREWPVLLFLGLFGPVAAMVGIGSMLIVLIACREE